MSEQDNIRTVRKLFENLNSHDLNANNPLLASDIRTEAAGSPGPMTNRDQGQMYTRGFLEAFPDLHFDIKDIFAQGTKVAVSWVAKGTHDAPLRSQTGDSIPATHKKVTVPGCTIYEFRNEMVSRQEIYWDQMMFLTQLGLVADPTQLYRATR